MLTSIYTFLKVTGLTLEKYPFLTGHTHEKSKSIYIKYLLTQNKTIKNH